MLEKVERELEGVRRLNWSLRRLEENVNRSLRLVVVKGGGRRVVIEKVREEFNPAMRDAMCEMNLLVARIQLVNLALVRDSKSSRVPRQRVYED